MPLFVASMFGDDASCTVNFERSRLLREGCRTNVLVVFNSSATLTLDRLRTAMSTALDNFRFDGANENFGRPESPRGSAVAVC